MLKMFSAAVIAASILAAPAMAAGPGRTVTTHKVVTTEHHVQPGALNANAKMIHRHHDYRHHQRHVRPHFHFHKKLGVSHTHKHTAIQTTVVHKRG
ncbi:His-rich protein BRANT [Tardiphaga robiniae]|uniref:His-rich protein BRANT n=1 Tax=Tardiphaga robiniae TaxID=943830 RepID=UPI0009D67801|nr:hypothetical protein [Tardiphaga robiniae]